MKKLHCLQNEHNDLIDTTQRQDSTRISRKLIDRTTNAKTYWSILIVLNDKNSMNITFLYYNVNEFSINENDSKLPSNLVHHTNEKLSHVTFNSEHIGKVIRFRSQ